jgi:hypothetical protein
MWERSGRRMCSAENGTKVATAAAAIIRAGRETHSLHKKKKEGKSLIFFQHRYWLTVTQDTQMFIHLARQDGRMRGAPTFKQAIGCYLFVERDLTKRKVHRYPNDLLCGQPVFIESREFSLSAVIPTGNYILMPCTFDPNERGRFFLSVYAEDPVVCGEVGYGPSDPAKVTQKEVVFMFLISWFK